MSCLQSGAPLATETMTAELSDGILAGPGGYFMGVTTLFSYPTMILYARPVRVWEMSQEVVSS